MTRRFVVALLVACAVLSSPPARAEDAAATLAEKETP